MHKNQGDGGGSWLAADLAAAVETPMDPEREPDRCADARRCEKCGGPALVCTLVGYQSGTPVFRDACLECADEYVDQSLSGSAPRVPISIGTLLVTAGMLIGVSACVVDYLGLRGSAGFGVYQWAGLVIGVLLVLFGAVLRVEFVSVMGALLLGLATTADIVGISGAAGVGWKQRLAFLVAMVLIVVGLAIRQRGSSGGRMAGAGSDLERVRAGGGS